MPFSIWKQHFFFSKCVFNDHSIEIKQKNFSKVYLYNLKGYFQVLFENENTEASLHTVSSVWNIFYLSLKCSFILAHILSPNFKLEMLHKRFPNFHG